jgi:hypothetical protein
MSYNITKVSTKEPDTTGEITLNLADVSSVSTPSTDQVLEYNGASWTNQSVTVVNEYERGLNSTNNLGGVHNNSGTVLTNTNQPAGQQRFHYWFRNTPSYNFTNYTANASNDVDLTVYTLGSSLFYKVTINNAGLYRLFFKYSQSSVYGSANQAIELQWSNGDNTIKYGPRVRLQRVERKSVPVIGYIDASAGDEVGLYKHALYNTCNDEMGAFLNYLCIIEKLS